MAGGIDVSLEAVSYGLDECNRTRNYFKSIQLDQSSPDYYDKLQIIDNKLQANYNRECELYSRQSELYNRRDKVERKIDEVRQILKDTNLAYYDVEKRHKQLSKVLDNAYQRSKESYNAASSLLKRLTGGEYNSGSHLKIDDFEAIIDFADNVQSRKEDMISLSEELNSALSLLQSSMQDKIVDNCSAVINDIENLSEGYFNFIEDVCGAYREAYNISKRYGN